MFKMRNNVLIVDLDGLIEKDPDLAMRYVEGARRYRKAKIVYEAKLKSLGPMKQMHIAYPRITETYYKALEEYTDVKKEITDGKEMV